MLRESAGLESVVSRFTSAEQETEDVAGLLELASEEEDTSMMEEIVADLEKLERKTADLETTRMLGDPLDGSNAFVQFSPGAGGVDSADWASMLLRMIGRYCEKGNVAGHLNRCRLSRPASDCHNQDWRLSAG